MFTNTLNEAQGVKLKIYQLTLHYNFSLVDLIPLDVKYNVCLEKGSESLNQLFVYRAIDR